MKEEMAVFKSFLRNLLVILLEIKDAISKGDNDTAMAKLDTLIKNTKSGIED